MKTFAATTILALLVASPCFCSPLPEDTSVVSIYTTLPTTSGTPGLDVYQQFANNLAERISSPFYRFFGVEKNKTENQTSTPKYGGKIEIVDDPAKVKQKTEDNEIPDRDVEELSTEASNKRKSDKKPEKVTLYNSYLPAKQNLEKNDTVNEIGDDGFEDEITMTLDDIDVAPESTTKSEGTFIYILELLGSLVQFAWGAFEALFKPKPANNTN